jgi:hypothetical protein
MLTIFTGGDAATWLAPVFTSWWMTLEWRWWGRRAGDDAVPVRLRHHPRCPAGGEEVVGEPRPAEGGGEARRTRRSCGRSLLRRGKDGGGCSDVGSCNLPPIQPTPPCATSSRAASPPASVGSSPPAPTGSWRRVRLEEHGGEH